MSIDLNGLSAKELDALIAQAKKRRTTLSKRKPIALVRKKLSALARAEGYTVAELFGGAAGTAPAKKVATGAAPSGRKST
jgi:DNA-binding protein H-NS